MKTRRFMMVGVTVMALAAGLQAQTTTKTKQSGGAPKYSATSMSGDVVMVDGNYLLVRMTPSGAFRAFIVPKGRKFVIDGQPKLIGDLKPGTSLTATIITRTQPVSLRTKTVTNGTVWYASGNYVIITLENGENREYNVPESYKFIVEGQPASAGDLKKGMKVSGTKIVSEPQTEISTETVVTGRAPR
jgi:hypothetical protein